MLEPPVVDALRVVHQAAQFHDRDTVVGLVVADPGDPHPRGASCPQWLGRLVIGRHAEYLTVPVEHRLQVRSGQSEVV